MNNIFNISIVAEAINALKKPIRTHPLGEFSERVVHFDDGKNVGRIRRKELLKHLSPHSLILIICGELSEGIRDFALEAAKKGHKVEIISGPETDATDGEIEELKSNKNITYLKALDRPMAHGVLAGRGLYLEDPHKHLEKYDTALVVENARDDVINSFEKHFKELKLTAVSG